MVVIGSADIGCLLSGPGVWTADVEDASDVHDVMELDRTPALCALEDNKLYELLVDKVGDMGVSSTAWGSSCATKEKVLLSLWIRRRFFGTGFGFEIGDPVAESPY